MQQAWSERIPEGATTSYQPTRLDTSNCSTYLKVSVHAQHVITQSLLETPHDCAAETPLRCSDDNADVVAFLLQALYGLHGAVARIIVYDNDLDLLRRNRRVVLSQCIENTGDEWSNVAILLVGGDDDGIVDGRPGGHFLW